MNFLDVMLFKDLAPMGMGSGSLFGAFLWIMIGMVVVIIALYVFVSFAYMSIAKKLDKTKPIGVSWIPGFGPLIVSWHASEMSWSSWLLLPVLYILYMLIISLGLFLPSIGLIILIVLTGITGLVFLGFFSAWSWKMFRALDRSGWWGLVHLIPVIGVGVIYFSFLVGIIIVVLGVVLTLVFLGIAAWGENNTKINKKTSVRNL